MPPPKTPTSTLISRDDKPDTFNSMPQWLEVIVALIICVVFAMIIMFLVKTAAHACGFAPPWFFLGVAQRGTGSSSEQAWQSSPFGRNAMSLAMTRLHPPPPAYIHPPSYLPPMPKDDMHHPKEVGGDCGGDAPILEAHASLPRTTIPVA